MTTCSPQAAPAPTAASSSRARALGAAALSLAALAHPVAARATGAPPGLEVPASDPALVERARELVEAGIRHEHGEGTTRDRAEAHALYCAAARLGSADALLRMGWMYANGRGLERDDSVAHTLFLRAASLGSEMGERLAEMIRGSADRLPDCLRAPAQAADRPRAARPVHAATPVIEQPAEFTDAPIAADRRRLAQTVVTLAREYQLDPRLVLAVVRAESGFDPLARSPKNAQGLMQLIPETAERFAVRNVFDPVDNLRAGMRYLRWLLSYFRGDVVLALAGYNAGERAVDRHRGVPPYPETLAYVQRIRALYPHDRHPFDAHVTAPSRWAHAPALDAAAFAVKTTGR